MNTAPQAASLITVRTEQGSLQLPAGSTLAQAMATLLASTGQAPEAVATAVNGQFVARGARAQHTLHDGDTVLCFSPITGG